MMLCVPIVNAIQTDKIYVGETGIIGGVPTYDYDAQKGDGYIVWIRALDIYDNSGNAIPNGDPTDHYDPSWIMIQDIRTGLSWNITPDYDAGFRRTSPDFYYHADAVSIHNKKVIFSDYIYGGTLNYEQQIYMYNITTDETWHIPHDSLSTYSAGSVHQIFGDWIYFTHYDGIRYIYVYNYKTGEGRRIDGGATTTSNLGMNDEFMWFTDTVGTPDILKIYSLETGKLTMIDGTNVGANIYASDKASYDDQYLGLTLNIGGNWDSYIINLEGMNITSEGGDETIYWEDIADENLIIVDDEVSYDSYAPYTDGRYAIYDYTNNNRDIMIYDIKEDRKIYFTASSNDERLSDFTGSTILYHTNLNSFTHNNDATDDYDIYRSVSDTEAISSTFNNAVPVIIILVFAFFVVGVFAYLGSSGGGML